MLGLERDGMAYRGEVGWMEEIGPSFLNYVQINAETADGGGDDGTVVQMLVLKETDRVFVSSYPFEYSVASIKSRLKSKTIVVFLDIMIFYPAILRVRAL